jgi:glycosyltransferase involved in cell wall biosynthesis
MSRLQSPSTIDSATSIAGLVSVVFATFREKPERLERSIQSIVAQSYGHWEIVVCLEPGDPNLPWLREQAIAYPNRFVIEENPRRLGLSGSLARAVDLAKGEFVARLDSDDVCLKSRFAKQVSHLEANPAVFCVGSWISLVGTDGEVYGKRRYPAATPEIRRGFLFGNSIAHPTVMMRTKELKAIGSYDPSYTFAEDLELWLRALRNGYLIDNIQEVLVEYSLPHSAMIRASTRHWAAVASARRKHSLGIWTLWQGLLSACMWTMVSWIPMPFISRLGQMGLSAAAVRKIEFKTGSAYD